jgi:hypothetical protein
MLVRPSASAQPRRTADHQRSSLISSAGLAATPYAFRCGWFGHPGLNARAQLHRAFRSVPRPSSPPGAKTSPIRSYRNQVVYKRLSLLILVIMFQSEPSERLISFEQLSHLNGLKSLRLYPNMTIENQQTMYHSARQDSGLEAFSLYLAGVASPLSCSTGSKYQPEHW